MRSVSVMKFPVGLGAVLSLSPPAPPPRGAQAHSDGEVFLSTYHVPLLEALSSGYLVESSQDSPEIGVFSW